MCLARPLLAAHGAMRAGAGKLQIAAPDDIAVPLGIAMPEAMVVGFATARDGGFARRAVRTLLDQPSRRRRGRRRPGHDRNARDREARRRRCTLGKPLALDAALLHALARCRREARAAPDLRRSCCPMPAKWPACSAARRPRSRPTRSAAAARCADRYGAVVLVKGAESHVVAPDGAAWRYRGGGPGLGVSGSGDVLAGIVGGLLARGAEPLTALLWAVWLHGEAGPRLAKRVGPLGFLAREIPGEVPALLPPSPCGCSSSLPVSVTTWMTLVASRLSRTGPRP